MARATPPASILLQTSPRVAAVVVLATMACCGTRARAAAAVATPAATTSALAVGPPTSTIWVVAAPLPSPHTLIPCEECLKRLASLEETCASYIAGAYP